MGPGEKVAGGILGNAAEQCRYAVSLPTLARNLWTQVLHANCDERRLGVQNLTMAAASLAGPFFHRLIQAAVATSLAAAKPERDKIAVRQWLPKRPDIGWSSVLHGLLGKAVATATEANDGAYYTKADD